MVVTVEVEAAAEEGVCQEVVAEAEEHREVEEVAAQEVVRRR